MWDTEIPDGLIMHKDRYSARVQAESFTESSMYHDPGLAPEPEDAPMVLCTKFVNLGGLQMLPDPNTNDGSWQESYEHGGSFLVTGDFIEIKPKFKLV